MARFSKKIIFTLTLAVALLDLNPANAALVKPKGAQAPSYGIVFNPNGKERIDIWEDFQCANCSKFHNINKDFIGELITKGDVRVTFHTLSFLGADSVSLANASGCAADEGKFLAVHDLFFNEQSDTKNSGIWTNNYLISKLSEVGLTSNKFKKCITSGKYLKWVAVVQKSASLNKILATPTVLIDGKAINRATDYYNLESFKAAVANPASISVPSPAPTPSSYKLNFSVTKVFGIEPVIGKPLGPPPTTLGIGDLIRGTGNQIQATENITAQYVLMEWASGKILESSWQSAPYSGSLKNVIAGWQKGLIGMKVGGRRILIIPPDLAYGEKGSGSVGPNQTLVFVIDLLAVSK